jgi:hypothetical protein
MSDTHTMTQFQLQNLAQFSCRYFASVKDGASLIPYSRRAVKCRHFRSTGSKRTSRSVTTLTFKSPQFHLEHMPHSERREIGVQGRKKERMRKTKVEKKFLLTRKERRKDKKICKLTLSLSRMYKDDMIIITQWN